MSGNEVIEQPDVPPEKNIPKMKPEDFGYKKFKPGEHREALVKAKDAGDKDSEKELERLNKELDGAGEKEKILKPKELQNLDESIKLKKENKDEPKKSPEDLKLKERQAFVKIIKTLSDKPKFAVDAEGEAHVFEFKGLTKDGKDVKPQEIQKMLEHIDQGGDVPANTEFQFNTSFKKGRDENEQIDIKYRINLKQIMNKGLEATLSGLLELSYAAAETYDSAKAKTDKGTIESPQKLKEKKESLEKNPFEDMKKQLAAKNIQTSSIQAAQWNALEVSIPEKQKQISIVYDGEVFQLKEKRLDKNVETIVSSPSEVMQYIEKASK